MFPNANYNANYVGRRAAAAGASALTAAAARDLYRYGAGYKKAKKRPYKKKVNYKKKRTTRTLKKQVKDIKKSLKSDQAIHTRRERITQSVKNTSENQAIHAVCFATNTNYLENAAGVLRYYDPSTPGTLITAAAGTGTYSRQIHFESIYKDITLRNNYHIPCVVTLYSCVCKTDTDINPIEFYTAGVVDQGISLSSSSPLLYMSDIDNVTSNWRFEKVTKRTLLPGRQFKSFFKVPSFDYDPSITDSHSLLYQKKNHGHIWVIRVEGVIGHDTVAAEYAILEGGVDIVADTKYVITYDAGVNLHDFSYVDNSDTTTTLGVVSNMPEAGNQQYSVN